MPYKFEIYKDNKGEFRFRFKAPNEKNMFASEGYKKNLGHENHRIHQEECGRC